MSVAVSDVHPQHGTTARASSHALVVDDDSDIEMAPEALLHTGRLQLHPGSPRVGALVVPTVNAAVLTHGRGTVTTALEMALSRLAFPYWPRTSPYRCWHCGEAFDAAPWFVFMEQLPNGEWLVSGNFCMVGCVLAWLLGASGYAHERTSTFVANLAIIWRARRGMVPEDATPIPRAPPMHARIEFGGALPLREFRRQGGYEDVPPECPIVSAVVGQPFISAPSVVQIEELRGMDEVASAQDAIGWACDVRRETAVGTKAVPLQVPTRARRGERLPLAVMEIRDLLTARFGHAAALIPDAAFVWGEDNGGPLPEAVPAAHAVQQEPHRGGWFVAAAPRVSGVLAASAAAASEHLLAAEATARALEHGAVAAPQPTGTPAIAVVSVANAHRGRSRRPRGGGTRSARRRRQPLAATITRRENQMGLRDAQQRAEIATPAVVGALSRAMQS